MGGYPPHDTGVDEGETEVGNQSHRAVETLETEDHFVPTRLKYTQKIKNKKETSSEKKPSKFVPRRGTKSILLT